MKILITGGTGVIGAGLIPELLNGGHKVVLLSRAAEAGAAKYPERVTAFAADVSDAESLRGAADGCDGVIHIAGIADEKPPRLTFRCVNIDGTRHMLNEARRARVSRFVFISSLGAERGLSEYHKSKFEAERLVAATDLDWVILRPGNVYGPGDEVISMLLKIVRNLPAVPVVGWGDQKFQPIWFEDLGRAVAAVADSSAHSRRVLELAGAEVTTTREIIEKLCEITGRSPMTAPIPTAVVSAAARVADRFESIEKLLGSTGLTMPINTNKLQMLLEENVIGDPGGNALTQMGIDPTPLDIALRRLADELPELLPDEGVGAMERKRFAVRIEGSHYPAAELLAFIRENPAEVMPIDFQAEPGAQERVDESATLTAAIPGRGNIQVRTVTVSDNEIRFVTVEGHPLAGTVAFRADDVENGDVRFMIEIHARASNVLDWIALRTVGDPMQNANWRSVVKRVVELSRGVAREGITVSSEALDEEAATGVSEELSELVTANARREHALH